MSSGDRKIIAARPSYGLGNDPIYEKFTTVSHVAHTSTAVRIVEDTKLLANAVAEGGLCGLGVRAVWLTPNKWQGSFFGNIRFAVDWSSECAGKDFYFLGKAPYKGETYRILVTETDRSGCLLRYDPRTKGGPWWMNSHGEHFQGSSCVLHFLVEKDIDLRSVRAVSFVKHASDSCSVSSTACPHLGKPASVAGAEFLSSLAGRSYDLCDLGLTELRNQVMGPSVEVCGACDVIVRRLKKLPCSGRGFVDKQAPGAGALARALLRTLFNERLSLDRRAIVDMFVDIDAAEFAIRDVVAAAIGLPCGAALDNII